MDFTINEYVAHKDYQNIEDTSSHKHKFATIGELALIDYFAKNGFSAKFISRGNYDKIAITKYGVTMETDVRAWRDKSEYKNICKRLADDFKQYAELVELRKKTSGITGQK